MADTFDARTRSWIMSRVLSRGTRPELAVKRALLKSKCKFSANGAALPGNPDFVIRELRLAVFVNGCFWHWHGCSRSRMPATHQEYWRRKIARNVKRDRRSMRQLRAAGWRCSTVWECRQANGIVRLLARISALKRGDDKSCLPRRAGSSR